MNKVEVAAPWVGYVRVSSVEQADSGLSLQAQEEKIRAQAVVKGIVLEDVVVDAAESAKSLNRPGMQRVMGMVEREEISGIIIMKLDRLTRSVMDLGALVVKLKKHGVELASTTESLDTSSAGGRMVMNILVTLAQWEREVIAERTSTVLDHKRNRGERLGNVPYGFTAPLNTRDEKGKTVRAAMLAPCPEEQQIIREMRELRIGGKSYRLIADELNNRGHRTRNGEAWRLQYVASVLASATAR